jgi:cytochrome c oxidase assembly factor CtaG
VDTELTDYQRPWSSRPWLAAAGIALIVACLVPPLSVLARRYLFVESIQFCAFALAVPALVVLGAPWRLLPRGAARLAPGLAPRLAGAGRRWPSFVATLSCLLAWVVLCLFWRLAPVLDGLARHPVLVLPEALTLGAAGLWLWLELMPATAPDAVPDPVLDAVPDPMLDAVPDPVPALSAAQPSAPRRPRPERALVAALAMWSLWAIAYVLGFAHDSVVHAYDQAGSHLGTVADQEISAFLLWAAAGAAFVPVVFTVLLTWLRDGSESAGEPAGRMPGGAVRGWGPPARDRRRTPAR